VACAMLQGSLGLLCKDHHQNGDDGGCIVPGRMGRWDVSRFFAYVLAVAEDYPYDVQWTLKSARPNLMSHRRGGRS
jgi:hypothetical protein